MRSGDRRIGGTARQRPSPRAWRVGERFPSRLPRMFVENQPSTWNARAKPARACLDHRLALLDISSRDGNVAVVRESDERGMSARVDPSICVEHRG